MPDARSPTETNRLVERQLLRQLRNHGPMSRVDLIALTGLPRTGVLSTLNQLTQRGVVGEVQDRPDRARTVGRPAILLRLLDPVDVAVLDLGRRVTRLSGPAHGSVRHIELSAGIGSDPADIVLATRSALDDLGFDRPPSRLIVSVPGPVRTRDDPSELTPQRLTAGPLRRPVPDWLSDRPAEFLADRLGCPVLIENDANLAALGEADSGAAQGYQAVLHISVTEGLGSGFVFGGALFRGADGVAGELAHVSVDDQGEQCICGNRGCLMTFGSGPFLVDLVERLYGEPLTFNDIEALAAQDDPPVLRILGDFGRRIGGPIAVLVAMLNLDAVVLDARLGAAGPALVAGVREILARRVTPPAVRALSVTVGSHRENAIAKGAFALARNALLDVP